MYDKLDETGRVICQVCGEKFNVISHFHLKKHEMSISDYKKQFPDYPLAGKTFGTIIKYSKSDLFKKDEDIVLDTLPEVVPEETNSVVVEEVTSSPEQILEMVNRYNKRKQFSNKPSDRSFKDDISNVPSDKVIILNYLATIYPNIKNNYFVEKFQPHTKHLIFKLITDIAEPILKINFEFPNAFWHNQDIPNLTRNKMLENEGWKIIVVENGNPTIDHVISALKINNLI